MSQPVEQPLVLGALSTDPGIPLREQIRSQLDLGRELQGSFRNKFRMVSESH